MRVWEWFNFVKSKDCEVAWGAGVGVEEIANVQGLNSSLCETNVGETQLLNLMDELLLSHSDIFWIDETGACYQESLWFVCWAFCWCLSDHLDDWGVIFVGPVFLWLILVDDTFDFLATESVGYSMASSFWVETALVSWLVAELLSNETDTPATPFMHWAWRSLQKELISESSGLIWYLVSLINPALMP